MEFLNRARANLPPNERLGILRLGDLPEITEVGLIFRGFGFHPWDMDEDITETSVIPFFRTGDYIVNTGTVPITILGVETVIGDIVRSVSPTEGVLYGNIRGECAYLHIRWGATNAPQTLLTTPDEWIGVCSSNSPIAPVTHTDYSWYRYKGLDSYSVSLASESHVFPAGTDSALPGSATVSVMAYKGENQIPVTIGEITGQVTGLTTSVADNSTDSAKFTVSVTDSLVALTGVLTIPLTVDGISFSKDFSWSLAIKGDKGDRGETGFGIFGWHSTANLTNISELPGSQVGDCIVNLGASTRTILGINTPTGGVVKVIAPDEGEMFGSVRGTQGPVGNSTSNFHYARHAT